MVEKESNMTRRQEVFVMWKTITALYVGLRDIGVIGDMNLNRPEIQWFFSLQDESKRIIMKNGGRLKADPVAKITADKATLWIPGPDVQMDNCTLPQQSCWLGKSFLIAVSVYWEAAHLPLGQRQMKMLFPYSSTHT